MSFQSGGVKSSKKRSRSVSKKGSSSKKKEPFFMDRVFPSD